MTRYTLKQVHRFYKHSEFEKAYKVLLGLKEDYRNSGVFYAVWADLEMRVNDNLTRAEYLINEAHHLGCPEDYYHRVYGGLLWRQGQTSAALAEYELSVKEKPSVDNMQNLAEALSAARDSRAVSFWDKVLEKDPENGLAYAYLAREAARRGHGDKALQLVQRAEQLKHKDSDLLFEIGSVLYILGRFRRALDYFLKAESRGLRTKEQLSSLYARMAFCYIRADDARKAIEYSRKAVAIDPENEEPSDVLSQCKELIRALWCDFNYEKAYSIVPVALEAWPTDSELLAYMAGLEIVFKKNYGAGQNYMNKAFEHKNTDLDFLYAFKGELWFDDMGKKEEGLACLEKSVSLNRSAWNLTALGSRILDSDSEKAGELFKEALQLEPANPELISTIAMGRMKQGNWSEGSELGLKACALKPSDPLINVTAAHGHFGLKQFEKALEFYGKAEQLGYYDKVYLYNAIGGCYKELGNKKEARKYVKKALKIDPDSSEAKKLLSEVS